jgi:hypothetical protein
MTLLTYNEFKEIVDFKDSTGSESFNKIEQTKEETYLYGLIGGDLVAEVKDEEHPTLIELIKKCLAWEIYRHYIEIGNVVVNKNGTLNRDSEFSNSIEYKDKQSKLKAVVEVLQQYESRLIELIEAGEFDSYNDNTTVSSVNQFIITNIGNE